MEHSDKQELPKSIDPDAEQKTFEALTMDKDSFETLQIIRRHMKYIYEESRKKEKNGD